MTLRRFLSNSNRIIKNGGHNTSDLSQFQEIFKKSRRIVAVTGAGISAESGIATFRGSGSHWRGYLSQDILTIDTFSRNPSLAWEFYHYRREEMKTKNPNPAHVVLARIEKKLEETGRKELNCLQIVSKEGFDELHHRAGSRNVLELHGSLFRVKCTECNLELSNYDSPICEDLRGKGSPMIGTAPANIPIEKLPSCRHCSGLLRPAVVMFGENLDETILKLSKEELDNCDLCLVVGTSSVVYPAAMFAPNVAARGVPVAEFNTEMTTATGCFSFHFQGPSGITLPKAIAQFS